MQGAIVIWDRANALAEDGKLFNFEHSSEAVDILAPELILFKTGAKKVKYRTDMDTLGSTVVLALYSGPTTSANGTEIVPGNYNPTIGAPAPLIKIYHTPTKSDNGTAAYTRSFLGYSQGNVATGAAKSGGVWRTFPANTTFLAILTPKADDTKIVYSGDFYEVD